MNNKKTGIFGGVITGLIFLVVGTGLLWWNEGNNVKNIKTIDEISEVVIDVSSSEIDLANEGKLVATNGSFTVEDKEVVDNVFGVGNKTAILSRTVEIYEWEETEHTDEDYTRYTYDKVWKEELIDSSNFESGHTNPTTKLYDSELFAARKCKVGKYSLSSKQIMGLATDKTLVLKSVKLPEGFKVNGNYITNSKDINNPQVGDLRISFTYNDWTEISVMAVINGSTFSDYVSEAGKNVNEVREGLLTSKEIIKKMQDENNMLKWILRAVGTVVLICAYLAIISPITKLASYVPILGGIVGGIIFVICCIIGLIHSLLVIAIAWIRFRPVLGIILLAVVAVLVFFLVKIIKNKKNQKQTEPQPEQ